MYPEEKRSKITVVIPAKDEEQLIAEIIEAVKPYAAEVIVIDGHSTDRTREFAQQAGARVLLDNGKGKGEALRCSIPEVRTEVVVFIDADGSHVPEDIPKLVEPILSGEADHVTGSRLLGGSSELHGGFDECFRMMGSSFITACINKRFAVRLSDSQNGFRAIRTEVLKKLRLRENLTTIEQEMIMETLRQGFRMAEVPTHEYPRKYGKSHIRLTRIWHWYGLCLLRKMIF